jgi:hypothetical protein
MVLILIRQPRSRKDPRVKGSSFINIKGLSGYFREAFQLLSVVLSAQPELLFFFPFCIYTVLWSTSPLFFAQRTQTAGKTLTFFQTYTQTCNNHVLQLALLGMMVLTGGGGVGTGESPTGGW